MGNGATMKTLGLMSGTSMDGLDCILTEIYLDQDYQFEFNILDQKEFEIPESLKQSICNAVENHRDNHSVLHEDFGKFIAETSKVLLSGRSVDCATMHGQTIYHEERVKSVQIGNPEYLKNVVHTPVIYNVRKADIDAVGTGAPLMPFLDWLLFKNSGKFDITLNIGGIANITVIPESGKRSEVIGFDTGPGMALIDECCLHFWGQRMDRNGKYSADGKVNKPLLEKLMTHPFILKGYPKSTGRDEFGNRLLNEILNHSQRLEAKDLMRTLIAFTAKSISANLQNLRNFSPKATRLIVSGGGSHHPIIMDDLNHYTNIHEITDSVPLGIDPDFKEALLMAVLGAAKLMDIPANMTSVTGAKALTTLGDILE